MNAECVVVPVKTLKKEAPLVFEATVDQLDLLENHERAARLKVQRVWKGEVPEETTGYYVLSTVGPFLEVGRSYVFFTRPQNPGQRHLAGLAPVSPARGIWIGGCSSATPVREQTIQELGRSRPPARR